jgi:hypothetical protein
MAKLFDGREVQIDLLSAVAHFRNFCKAIIKAQEYQRAHPGRTTMEGGSYVMLGEADFEKELEKLNWCLRAWWADFKQDHEKMSPY